MPNVFSPLDDICQKIAAWSVSEAAHIPFDAALEALSAPTEEPDLNLAEREQDSLPHEDMVLLSLV